MYLQINQQREIQFPSDTLLWIALGRGGEWMVFIDYTN